MTKNILVLNLTRFGDAVQSTPLLRGLRAKYPSARITVAVQKKFAAVMPMVRGYDDVIEFDQDEAARLISLADNPLEPYMFVEDFVARLSERKYDLLINLTCTRMSAYLTSVLAPVDYSGISILDDGTRAIRGLWALYLYSVIMGDGRRFSRINLVDTFARMAGVVPDGKRVEMFETARGQEFAGSFLGSRIKKGRPVVGMQLGASETSRCWPVEKFAVLADELIEKHGADVVLLGSKNELHLARSVKEKMRHEAIDAVGATDIEQLFSVVKKCSLVISNDTGTMHFAAAAGVPVVMLCIGPAFFHCTGAYSDGNIALQPALTCSPCRYNVDCSNPECVSCIDVDDVMKAALAVLGKLDLSLCRFERVRVYRSRFLDDGFLGWDAVANPFPEDDIALRCGRMWKRCLDKKRPDDAAEAVFPEFQRLVTRGLALSTQVVQAVAGSTVNAEKVRTLGAMLATLETSIRAAAVDVPPLAPLVDMFSLLQDNIPPGDIKNVALRSRANYEHLRDFCASIR